MKPVMATACPDLESIAAYLDGRLSDRERARITEHLASCEDCYTIFSESVQTGLEESGRVVPMQTWRERLRRPKVLWSSAAAVLAMAAAVLLAVGAGVWRPGGREADLQALVAAVGTDRTIEPRLTGGFAYGPLRVLRSGEATVDVSSAVWVAAAQIEKDALEHRTPEALHALGVSCLVTGDATRAVTALEEAADRQSQDVHVLSDLAAAYLVRAARNNQPQDYARALTMADRAVKADPKLAEAWFNRAYALEKLSFADEARSAWRAYLNVDGASPWAEEARRHVRSP